MEDAPKVTSVTVPGGPFKAGYDPRRGRNGGRTSRLADIQRMLDDEHRTVTNIRTVFDRLKALALGEVVSVMVPGGEGETELTLRADSRFMALYLDRILGPVKQLISEEDLADAPDAVIEWLRRN